MRRVAAATSGVTAAPAPTPARHQLLHPPTRRRRCRRHEGLPRRLQHEQDNETTAYHVIAHGRRRSTSIAHTTSGRAATIVVPGLKRAVSVAAHPEAATQRGEAGGALRDDASVPVPLSAVRDGGGCCRGGRGGPTLTTPTCR